MQFGTSYYPELVPEAEWSKDLDTMQEAGLSVIRMLDFAWTAIEPREGEYDFAWLDRFLEQVQQRDMQVVMCTPTASPPPWLWRQFPEMGCVLKSGETLGQGARRTACVNHPVYQHFSRQLARRLGRQYGQHPAVTGWQIDNELIGPERPKEFICHCASCQWRFRDWLKQRYASVAEINRMWGLGFWSLDYSDWGEVQTPMRGNCLGLVLDAYRFYSDSQVQYIELQRDALRDVIDGRQFISHNSTGIFDRGIDHRAYAKAQDETGWDAYLGAAAAGHPAKAPFTALAHDLFRSSLGKPFWIYETNTNEGLTPAAMAEMRARGAKAIVFWHWRRHRANMEQNNAALCDHAGRPNRERLAMIRETRERLEQAGPLPAELAPRQAAIVFTPDCVRAAHRQARRPIPYLASVIEAYQPMWRHGVALDVAYPDEDISAYKLLVMPALSLISQRQAERVRQFVHEGGVLLASGPTAYKDLHGVFYPQRGEPLLNVLGFSIAEDLPADAVALTVATHDEQKLSVDRLVEHVTPSTATVLAQVDGGDLHGAPVALHHRVGAGQVFYAAAEDPALATWLSRQAVAAAGLDWQAHEHLDVGVTPDLTDPDRLWCFNHGDEPREVLGQTLAPGAFAQRSRPIASEVPAEADAAAAAADGK